MDYKPRTVSDELEKKRRKLPHWQIGGATYFVTFRLHNSPHSVAPLTTRERATIKKTVLTVHTQMCKVHLFTVMPDHVHLLLTPQEQSPHHWYSLSSILQRIKGNSAYAINQHRNRTGPFWQKESFDRIVRDEREYVDKATYILNNAVKAGIITDGWDYDGFWYDPEDQDKDP